MSPCIPWRRNQVNQFPPRSSRTTNCTWLGVDTIFVECNHVHSLSLHRNCEAPFKERVLLQVSVEASEDKKQRARPFSLHLDQAGPFETAEIDGKLLVMVENTCMSYSSHSPSFHVSSFWTLGTHSCLRIVTFAIEVHILVIYWAEIFSLKALPNVWF